MMQQPNGMMPPQVHPISMDQQHMQQPQYPPVPPPQQWMMMPPPQQVPPPQQLPPPVPQSSMWAPPVTGPPLPQPQLQHQSSMQQQQQQYAQAPVSPDEIRSLWIGDLQYWMDENYMWGCFAHTGEVMSVKVIRNRHNGQSEGYGFIEFVTRVAAEKVLQAYNGTLMPNAEQNFRMNWATFGAGERRSDDTPDYTIFVGDLASDVTDYLLQETFRVHYQSVKGAKVVTDRTTGRSKGYGFVRFGDEGEQVRAMTEMNGMFCSTRAMRIGPAATKKPMGTTQPYQNAAATTAASSQSPQHSQGESDPNNTTIFVGGLDTSVSDDHLRQVFSQFGELIHVKIPAGKRCGFVQFTSRACAEQAMSILNGTQLGGQNIRLSWGRSPMNKQQQQQQPDQGQQWNLPGAAAAGYYGYPQQGYDPYGYPAPPPQDPNMYYGGYAGYGYPQVPLPPQQQ